ncbi:hypothetical protein GT755_33475 [Herbidospora sp. NEAU-GS84]|uniref:Uncharacterized protein n=1 Tax=Herbidospora solisilvae TaxID=2696284 RepID=A0A7C9NJ15_9ACTN|nr:hypothetical protein [Herbidospora solisilvae]NAS26575.1 hypothetical protein [Herbidospora solisilvae]
MRNEIPAMDTMRRTFDADGLAPPPIPVPLRPRLREQQPWVFTTRDIDPDRMYRFDTAREHNYLHEALSDPVEDYVAVSHAGHGVNSFSINYFLVYGPVMVFAQALWGGVYTDRAKTTEAVGAMFRQCAELIETVDAAKAGFPGRVFVAVSDFRQHPGVDGYRWVNICRRLAGPLGDRSAAVSWLDTTPVISTPDGGEPPSGIQAATEIIRSF